MMMRILTVGTIITLSSFSVPAHAEEQENKNAFQTGSFSTGGIESKSYAAFNDPAPFDPSSVEPAAGEEDTGDITPDTQGLQSEDQESTPTSTQE